jgi:hypothetical protein
MTICHIFYAFLKNRVVLSSLFKGFKMSILIKNAQSLFQRFENNIEILAKRFF